MKHRRAALLAAPAVVLALLAVPARAEERATLIWKGETHPLGTLGGREFVVSDAARALGFTVSSDANTGVLTISGHGHQILVGPGTAQVPVDRRIIPISAPARQMSGALYAPADFREGPLPARRRGGRLGSGTARLDAVPATPAPLSMQVAVVHVAPTTQVVLRLSAPRGSCRAHGETGFQVRFPAQRLTPPFPERRYEDPLVPAVRFSGDSAFIDFREPGPDGARLPAHQPGPDRHRGRAGGAGRAPAPATTPVPPPPGQPITIVIDPGHGGGETGAIGPGGLQEKEVTLQLARRLAATIPRVLACRVVLTRDTDVPCRWTTGRRWPTTRRPTSFSRSTPIPRRPPGRTARRPTTSPSRLPTGSPRRSPGARTGQRDRRHALLLPSRRTWISSSGTSPRAPTCASRASWRRRSRTSSTSSRATENRGIKQAPFRVLVGAAMPAVLIEAAFISNEDEEKRLRSPVFQQTVAEAIARALARFFSRRLPGALRSAPARPPRLPCRPRPPARAHDRRAAVILLVVLVAAVAGLLFLTGTGLPPKAGAAGGCSCGPPRLPGARLPTSPPRPDPPGDRAGHALLPRRRRTASCGRKSGTSPGPPAPGHSSRRSSPSSRKGRRSRGLIRAVPDKIRLRTAFLLPEGEVVLDLAVDAGLSFGSAEELAIIASLVNTVLAERRRHLAGCGSSSTESRRRRSAATWT